MTSRHNLLTDPLIRVSRDDGATEPISLPGVLAALTRDEVTAFPALAPYQGHAWHAFLVQLAALALHRAGREEPSREEEDWRGLLRGLTPDHADDAPWVLAVAALEKPAFLQPPVPEGNLADFRNSTAVPDEIDVLVTAKNHDVKSARLAAPQPDHWVFALVSLQTMQGFLGAGNYGISRMNGGFASRPAVGLVWSARPGQRFLRDTAVLLLSRGTLLEQMEGMPSQGGLALVWLEPWDGRTALGFTRLDPWYIEICRRVRLVEEGGHLLARSTGTKSERIAAKALKGDTGDPWTPVNREEGKALTIGGGGFHYRLMQELLLQNTHEPSLMQRLHPIDGGRAVFVLARALARGQGETNGYHERLLPVPEKARDFLFDAVRRDSAGRIGQKFVEDAASTWGKVLRPALFALMQAGPQEVNWQHKESAAWCEPWHRRFDRAVNDAFFPALWAAAAEEDPPRQNAAESGLSSAHLAWQRRLQRLARDTLEEAIGAAPVPLARRYRAIAAADRVFGGAVRKAFPNLYTTPDAKEGVHDVSSA